MKQLLGLAVILVMGTGLCLAQPEATREQAPPPQSGALQMAQPAGPMGPGMRPDAPPPAGDRPAEVERMMRERARTERAAEARRGDRPPGPEARERGDRPPGPEARERGDRPPGPEARERMREHMMGPEAAERNEGAGPGIRERLRARMGEPLSPDEETRARELIGHVRPWEMERLENLQRENPHAYQMLLRRALMEQQTLERLHETDPDAHQARMREFEFERREHELAQQFQDAKTEEEKQQVEQQLNEVLHQHFDVRTENHRREMQRAQEQLESLQQQLSAREQRKEALIEQMRLRLTGRGDMLEF